MTIQQWAPDDRPREKMMAHGAGALSDAELLAILIGSGSSDETAVELMIDEVKNFDMKVFLAFQRTIHEEELQEKWAVPELWVRITEEETI